MVRRRENTVGIFCRVVRFIVFGVLWNADKMLQVGSFCCRIVANYGDDR